MAQGRHRRVGGSGRAGPVLDRSSAPRPPAAGEHIPNGRSSHRNSLVAAAIGVLAALAVIAIVISAQRGGDGASATQARVGSESAAQSDTALESGESDIAANGRDIVRASAQWVRDNLPSDARVLADAAIDAELTRINAPQQHALVDGAGAGATSAGWRDYDYIVSTEGLRRSTDGTVFEAIASSSLLASFGPEPSRIEVRRLEPQGPEAIEDQHEAQAAAGAQLAGSPKLKLTPETATLLREGAVDPRLLVVLAAAADRHELAVSDFPARAGEEAAPRHTVVIAQVDGQSPAGTLAGEALRSWIDAQEPPFAPASAVIGAEGMVIGFDLAAEAPVDFLADLISITPLPA